MIWTVFTGDIVESTALSAKRLDDVMNCLERLSHDISAWSQGAIAAFGRRGGDGWQLAVNASEYGLRSTLYLQSSLMALDPAVQSRIGVATGKGTLSDANPNSAHGPAFNDSGRLLDTLSGNTLFAHAAGGPLDATYRLADHIAQGWTQAQARAVAAMLPPGTGPRRVAADRLGISRQAIDQALHAAGYPALHDALTLLETSE